MISPPEQNEEIVGEVAFMKGQNAEKDRYTAMCRVWVEESDGKRRDTKIIKMNILKDGEYMERDDNGVPKVLNRCIEKYRKTFIEPTSSKSELAEEFEKEKSFYRETSGSVEKIEK